MDMKTALRKAADLLEQRGWCRRAFEDEYGRLCTFGAINMAVLGTNGPSIMYSMQFDDLDLIEDIENSFREFYGIGILDWNDGVCQDKQEAVNKLMELADGMV